MTKQEEQKKLSKIIVLISLLADEIDEIQPTETLKEVHEKCNDLQEVINPVLDKVYSFGDVSKSTFINDMASKFEYNFRKLYKI